MKSIYDITEQDEQSMKLLYSAENGKAYGYAPGGDTYIASSIEAYVRCVPTVYVEYEGATFWPYVLCGELLAIQRPNVGDRIPLDVLPQWAEAALRVALRRTERAMAELCCQSGYARTRTPHCCTHSYTLPCPGWNGHNLEPQNCKVGYGRS